MAVTGYVVTIQTPADAVTASVMLLLCMSIVLLFKPDRRISNTQQRTSHTKGLHVISAAPIKPSVSQLEFQQQAWLSISDSRPVSQTQSAAHTVSEGDAFLS